MTTQIRLKTLLNEDTVFRAWFAKPPTITVFTGPKPWRIFVQTNQGGPWARADFATYAQAYTQVKLRLSNTWDMAIHCKPQHFHPPVVRLRGRRIYMPMPEGHEWCEMCRRPVIFAKYIKHPNMKYNSDPESRRCSICGMRAVAMNEYRSPLSWPAQLVR